MPCSVSPTWPCVPGDDKIAPAITVTILLGRGAGEGSGGGVGRWGSGPFGKRELEVSGLAAGVVHRHGYREKRISFHGTHGFCGLFLSVPAVNEVTRTTGPRHVVQPEPGIMRTGSLTFGSHGETLAHLDGDVTIEQGEAWRVGGDGKGFLGFPLPLRP